MDKFLTPNEIAELLKVDPRTVRNWINNNKLEAVKLGNRWRIKKDDFDKFIEERKGGWLIKLELLRMTR